MQCPRCQKALSYADILSLVRAKPAADRAVIRASLSSQLQAASVRARKAKPPPANEPHLPCHACREKDRSLNRVRITTLKKALAHIPAKQKASLQASLGSSLRKTFGVGPGAPRSDKPRCPCQANTLYRATLRNFDCCREAGVPNPWTDAH